MAEKRSAQPLTDPVLEYKRELQRLDLLRAQQPIEDGAGTRARLLSAAVSLFARRGFDACTMRDLAAAVGIKAPAIYNHFSSKEEILGEAVEYALADFFGCVLDQLESDPRNIASKALSGGTFSISWSDKKSPGRTTRCLTLSP